MFKKQKVFLYLTLMSGLFAAIGCASNVNDSILGVEEIKEVLPFYDRNSNSVRDPREGDKFPPMRVLLSRSRYWAQDGHMDIVVQLDASLTAVGVQKTQLLGRILDLAGEELADFTIEPPGERFVFYPVIPQKLFNGGEASIELTWADASGKELASYNEEFRVERFNELVTQSGSIPIRVPNEAGAVEKSFPVTAGVPFPRGALYDISRLRLVAVDGDKHTEIPLQVNETARWSKFGPVKWVHIDFTVDLPGTSRELELQYGPEVKRMRQAEIKVQKNENFPVIHAGRLRFADGLWFDAEEKGNFVKVLEEQGLYGAFVEHEDKRFYRMSSEGNYEIEESGPEKIVLKREDWYMEEKGGQKFCKYITRYVIHRNSPLLRIFHSWIFTGDGNRDRIANMGWEFPLAEGFQPEGFLGSLGEGGQWLQGDYLLQYDYEHFELVNGQRRDEFPGGRAPGVAAAQGNGIKLYFGTRDFWQNYPSELEFRDGSLWFHNWPKHNKPARYTFEGRLITTPGEPALASAARHDHYKPGILSRSEWKLNLIQARFAHEGEMLNFRLPDRVTEDPIWSRTNRGSGSSIYWEKDNPESANAQGISRTEEMWLYLISDKRRDGTQEKIMEGLNNETLRAVVDPAWVAQSGAMYEIHHQDWQQYPEEEHSFEQLALAPARWQEKLGMYGMWLYGDLAIWGEVSLERHEPQLYRGLRKRHHGWPYSWIPYARSGDPRLLRAADAAARQNIDANHCHFVSEEVRRQVEEGSNLFHRRKGLLHRSTLPWAARRGATTRCYEVQMEYLLDAWYLNAYHRAKDMVLELAQLTKVEEDLPGRGPIRTIGGRGSFAVLETCIETWEAAFDPWFLVAAHSITEGHLLLYEQKRFRTHGSSIPRSQSAGHFYNAGDREFLLFSGNRKFHKYYLAYANFWGDHWYTPSWQWYGAPMVEPNVYAWNLTGEDYYLRRVSYFIDWLKVAVWNGETPDYARGYYSWGGSHAPPIYTGWALQYFPLALAALEKAGHRPEPFPDIFEIQVRNPVIAVKKEAGQPVTLRLRGAIDEMPGRTIPDRTVRYSVIAPNDKETLGGNWQMQQPEYLELSANEPAGVYHLSVKDARKLVVPVASKTNVQEVMILDAGEEVLLGRYNNQVWFYVPEETKQFYVQIPLSGGHHIRKISIWNPDGIRVWDMNYHNKFYKGEDPVTAMIKVEPEQAGKLWRITLPGSNNSFMMDPQIPPVYSTTRDKWFMPD